MVGEGDTCNCGLDDHGVASDSIDVLLKAAANSLVEVSDSANLDAQLLLAQALGCERSWLLAFSDVVPDEAERNCFLTMLARRQGGEPMAYILGHKHFWKHEFRVTPATLIPRPETELLVETALEKFDKTKLRVADLGTGSGAIAISLATERPGWQIIAVEHSADALAVAAWNLAAVDELAGGSKLHNIQLIRGNWCECLEPCSLDLIVSNPPYIKADDPHFPALAFEPRQALVAGTTGLEAIRQIIPNALPCLVPGGMLMIEHGSDQADAVQALFAEWGYADIGTVVDLNGHPRITQGRKAA